MPDQLLPPNIVHISKKLDALIDLLDTNTDALAAKWDQVESLGEENFQAGDDFTPTIQ